MIAQPKAKHLPLTPTRSARRRALALMLGSQVTVLIMVVDRSDPLIHSFVNDSLKTVASIRPFLP